MNDVQRVEGEEAFRRKAFPDRSTAHRAAYSTYRVVATISPIPDFPDEKNAPLNVVSIFRFRRNL